MYIIMDEDDEPTGHSTNIFEEATDKLDHCPVGWYIYDTVAQKVYSYWKPAEAS